MQLRHILLSIADKAPEIIMNKVVSETERLLRDPVRFRRDDLLRSRAVARVLRKSHDASDWVRLTGPPGRGAFLAACLAVLRDQPEEWAVVGLGTAARRSFVKEVFVRRGKAGSVGLPTSVQAQIRGHLEETSGGEVIHVHNHPAGLGRTLKNLVLGAAPVTSDADRSVRQAHDEVARVAASKTLTRRSVRFFLVENDLLHEYWLPAGRPILDELADRFGLGRAAK